MTLFSGIIVAILSLAQLMNYLLHHHPVPIWSLSFGTDRGLDPGGRKTGHQLVGKSRYLFLAGILAAAVIVNLIPIKTPETLWFIFLCGVVAICAMILPGISGAFILLILGKYEFITGTLKNPFLAHNIIVILVFCLGCGVGLAGFSRVLNYLLGKFHNLTLAFLAGLITGSLMKIWPWKEILETQVIRGKAHVIWGRPIMPNAFGGEFYFAIALMALGFLGILVIERWAKAEV